MASQLTPVELTRGVLASTVEVHAAPVVAGTPAKVQLLVGAQAAVADADAEMVDGVVMLDSVLHVVKPGGLAVACRVLSESEHFDRKRMRTLAPILGEHANANVGPSLTLLDLLAGRQVDLGTDPGPGLGARLGRVLAGLNLDGVAGDGSVDVDAQGSGVDDGLGNIAASGETARCAEDGLSSQKAK